MKVRLYLSLVAIFLSFHFAYGQTPTIGLLKNDSTAFNGYTLLTSFSYTDTYLIDNCGLLVNQWQSTSTGGVGYLLENGNLLRTERYPTQNFNGGGVAGRVELKTWDDNLIWQAIFANDTMHQHHDVEYLPNGNILILAWELKTDSTVIEAGRDSSLILNNKLWSEQLLEIQPIGSDSFAIVWEWHVWDHLVQTYDSTKVNYGIIDQHPERININYLGAFNTGNLEVDWLHLNAVDYNSDLDQVMLNSRNFGEFWVIDHSTTSAEAASSSGGNAGKGGDILYRWGNPFAYGKGTLSDQVFYGQHDAHWIETGPHKDKIMVFNNGVARPQEFFSSVDILEPVINAQGVYQLSATGAFLPDSLMSQTTANPPESLFAVFVSGAQEQPNGNILICNGPFGRIIEMTPNDSIAWEYIMPVTSSGPTQQGNNTIGGNTLFRAYRYAEDYAGLSGQDLTPTVPIEINPYPSICEIYTFTENTTPIKVNVYPNPTVNYLTIEQENNQTIQIVVYDVQGKKISDRVGYDAQLTINTSHWNTGMYFVQIIQEEQIKVYKILKIND